MILKNQQKLRQLRSLAPSILLFVAAIAAAIIANSPLAEGYQSFLAHEVHLRIGSFNLFSHGGEDLRLLEFINDGLMTIFFLLVGLEIKRELQAGELSSVRKATLPVVAACGGMLLPVLVYMIICPPGSEGGQGLAIPMATDIAFSLGVLSLLGSRVPLSLKIFLTAFAVVDDIGGILVIAMFYSSHVSAGYLLLAAVLYLVVYMVCRYLAINRAFLFVAAVVGWYLFLQSGIHSTLSGVILAFVIPLKPNASHVQAMEHSLSGVVSYLILPLFAFVNAGVMFGGGSDAMGRVTVAVAVGLLIGKFVGIYAFTWLAVRSGVSPMPRGMTWKNLSGIAMLGGVGFTVSLFIGNLSFADQYPHLLNQAKMGVLVGSILSGLLGYMLLRSVLKTTPMGKEKYVI